MKRVLETPHNSLNCRFLQYNLLINSNKKSAAIAALCGPTWIGRVWGLCGDYQGERNGEFRRGDIGGGRVNFENVNM